MRINSQTGIALLTVIIIVIFVFGLIVAIIATVSSKSQLTAHNTLQQEVSNITYAGLDMAKLVLVQGHPNGWNDELQSSTTNFSSYNPNDPPINAGTNPALFQWARDINCSDGRYWTYLQDNNDGDGNTLTDADNIVNINVRGFNGNNENIVVFQCRYQPPIYEPESAIVSGGSVKLNGNATISGTSGSVSVNGNVIINGSPYISQDVSATGTIDITGNPTIGGATATGVAPFNIPPIVPADYYSYRDYLLDADGKVYDAGGGFLWDTVVNGEYRGWELSGGEWKMNSNTAYDGTYYVNGTAAIGGNPGDAATPWRTTIIATDSIVVSGNPKIAPSEQGTLYIAGRDIKITGNSYEQTEPALIAAHEQISIKGNSGILGSVLAEDKEDLSPVVSTSSDFDVSFAGNPTITYNGGLSTIIKNGDPYIKILGFKREK
ncbi:MAG: hypothetical protein HY762_02480 [Planctomycetes bacterium]|nr:hypothetical protein [Planctomycetota bacterium]